MDFLFGKIVDANKFNLFYILSLFALFLAIQAIVQIAYFLIYKQKDAWQEWFIEFYLNNFIINFVGYFTNRLLYQMCSATLGH